MSRNIITTKFTATLLKKMKRRRLVPKGQLFPKYSQHVCLKICPEFHLYQVSCFQSVHTLFPPSLFWISGKQWLIVFILVPLPFPTTLRDHCQWPFILVSSLLWDVICLGQESWIYLEPLRFTFTINSPTLGFNSLMSMFVLPVSVWQSPSLMEEGEEREKLTSFVFSLPPSLHADTRLIFSLPPDALFP